MLSKHYNVTSMLLKHFFIEGIEPLARPRTQGLASRESSSSNQIYGHDS